MPARARRSRQRSIRALLALALAVPLVSLLALWVYGTDVTMSHYGADHAFASADRLYSGPAQALGFALTAERLQMVTWLSVGGAPPAALRADFQATDRAAASFVAAASADQAVIPAAAQPALHAMESQLAGRAAVRSAAESGRLSALDADQSYGAILAAVALFDAKLLVVDDAALSRQAAATVAAAHGVQLTASEVALVSGAVAAGGAMSPSERVQFAQDMAGAHLLFTDALAVLDPSLGAGFQRAMASAAYRGFAAIEEQIAGSAGAPGSLPVGQAALTATAVPLSTDYQTAERQDAAGLTSLAGQANGQSALAAALVAGLGLLAVLLAVALVIGLWWLVSREATGLEHEALTLTDEGLAASTGRVEQTASAGGLKRTASAGRPEAVSADQQAETVPVLAGHIREIARATAALSTARQIAQQAVTAQGELRTGASQLFRSLGVRSHGLAERQLRLLDLIGRGTSDTHTRSGLSAVGQLSTQLRRQADALLVLSGGAPALTALAPVPIGDLIRWAAAEVDDDKTRVTVVSDNPDAITIDATADVRYLITELVENAVRHTPPLTEVTVRAGRVGRGLAVEVEDRGPGLGPDALASANALLADPPDTSLLAGDRIGLLVVARLAARHGITVTLRASPIGGTTAIVLLPHAVLAAGEVRDTIADGSLPRIDPDAPPPGGESPETGPGSTQPARRVAPYVPAEPEVPPAPVAETLAPWYWLTESEPARPPAAPAAFPAAPTPLPRRIRPGAAAIRHTAAAAPPVDPDQPPTEASSVSPRDHDPAAPPAEPGGEPRGRPPH